MAGRRWITALLLCLWLCLMPCTALAASTTNATEPIDTARECTLDFLYRCEGTAVSDVAVRVYHVADVSADFQYTLTAPFEPTALTVNGIRSNGEWTVIRSTLEAYVLANNIPETLSAVSDAEGRVWFENLKPGLYLALSCASDDTELPCVFEPSLVALPGLGADGVWQYQVTVTPKYRIIPPIEPDGELQLKVLKLWKGDEGQGARPSSVEAEIFRNGESYRKIELSQETDWAYSWTVPDDGAEWVVVERNVPNGYVATVDKRDGAFVLTNTWDAEQSPPDFPETGDTTDVMLYVVLMNISGIALILLALIGKRKRT